MKRNHNNGLRKAKCLTAMYLLPPPSLVQLSFLLSSSFSSSACARRLTRLPHLSDIDLTEEITLKRQKAAPCCQVRTHSLACVITRQRQHGNIVSINKSLSHIHTHTHTQTTIALDDAQEVVLLKQMTSTLWRKGHCNVKLMVVFRELQSITSLSWQYLTGEKCF